MKRKKILLVFGTRPEAIKMAPLIKELEKNKKEFVVKVCVTAQHRQMLDSVLKVFSIRPDYDLNIMQEGQTLYHITSEALKRSEKVLVREKPDLVLVHGDTTTTFAMTLSAFYQKIPAGHVEAGLRSYNKDHPYPEEANRLLADALCALHFAPTNTCKKALLRENIPAKGIFITGNTVIDALKMIVAGKKSFGNAYLDNYFKTANRKKVILITAHRRENQGKPFENIFRALRRIALKYTGSVEMFYPVHLSPKVQEPAKRILKGVPNMHLLNPVNYSDMAKLMNLSYLVITDSGGLQEEAPSLGKPVVVLREVTERPDAVKAGTVKVVGTKEENVFKQVDILLKNRKAYNKMAKAVNPYGDGRASWRTSEAIKYYFRFKSKRVKNFGHGR